MFLLYFQKRSAISSQCCSVAIKKKNTVICQSTYRPLGDGWMDGWMDGWIDGWIDRFSCSIGGERSFESHRFSSLYTAMALGGI